jgi:hypothetical protein
MTLHRPAKLLIVGDSVALGATVVVGKEVVERATPGFVDCLKWRRALWTIDTDAEVHRTTVQAMPLLPRLLTRYRPDIVLFVLGGSDADIDWRRFVVSRGRKVRNNTQLDTFRIALRTLVDTAITGGACPVLSDIPSQDVVKRGKWMSQQVGQDVLPWIEAAGGQGESDRRHAEYTRAVERVAAEAGVDIARWAQAISSLPADERFGQDATHPSIRAYALITDVVEQSIDIAAGRLSGASLHFVMRS